MGYDFEEISQRILLLERVAMRLEVKEGVRNCLLINDTYNSDLNSLAIALDFLHQQATDKNLSRTLIISDILQSGLLPDELYGTVVKLIQSKAIDKIIGIGPEISKQSQRFSFIKNEFF